MKRSWTPIAALALAASLPIARIADAQTAAPRPRAASAPAAAAPAAAKPASLPLLAVPSVALPGAASAAAAAAPAAGGASASAATTATAAPASASAATGPAASASGPAMVSAALTPGAPTSAPVAGTLDGRIQDVKADVIKLNRDLLVLEEELLFPANTQVALFVSMDVGKMFQLDSVQIKLDDKVVANYLYTQLEVEALHRGGVQRVYLGNLKTGQHELVAFFTGKGPHDRNYRRGANVKFEKTTDAKYIELRIQDSTGKLQPEFDIKLWQ
jgi:hypothetical protein